MSLLVRSVGLAWVRTTHPQSIDNKRSVGVSLDASFSDVTAVLCGVTHQIVWACHSPTNNLCKWFHVCERQERQAFALLPPGVPPLHQYTQNFF